MVSREVLAAWKEVNDVGAFMPADRRQPTMAA